ncbi:two-component regulator propeller domain-containing protein [Dyadobacter subterraneus]|uniref:Histidine kinase n=1 Tax=Dyadobacter subterraneus TaxID=2773304 RepID=A0ABR9W9P5_9BACT|nr:two-component regulator propeller domain-containing protein [Dyadobacter subterraneus]MBE9462175.1 histidine kinase [Dyadobacter subterraneus]
MKYAPVYVLLVIAVFYNSCQGQNKTDLPKATTNSETDITSREFSSVTRTITQDRKGNMWIATFGGVFRYDGKSFTNITSQVSSAPFFSVLEDRKGNFWFSSVGSGVYYYDPRQADGKAFQNFTTRDGLASNQVTYIYEDKTGAVWFSTVSGASRYDGKSFRNYLMNEDFEGFRPNDHNEVNSIIEDKTGKFWFGTKGRACKYDGKTFTVITHDGKPFTNVRSIIEDKKGAVWLGGSDGLWRYDGGTFTNLTQDFVGYIIEDKKGNIWTSSRNVKDGSWILSCYDENSLSSEKPAVKEIRPNLGMIFGISEANDGSIWFGSGGVYRYDGNTITDFKKKEDQK